MRAFRLCRQLDIYRHYSTNKRYEDIPGPQPWPLAGNALLFSPLGKNLCDT